jgi:sulfite exporter TauE/SafE
MIELPLVLIAGTLGSSHCLGMCGPFALTIGASSHTWGRNLRRQLVYTSGRVFTYSVFGAVAGFCGWRLVDAVPGLVNVPALLAIIAGVLIVWQGLKSAGVFRSRKSSGANGPCLAGTFFASFLRSDRRGGMFLAGMFTGMLPCGLVYAFVAMAASSANMWVGLATMVAFGLGTAPLMILAGVGGSLLNLAARRHLFRVAAWCVVLTGAISIGRGAGFIHIPGLYDQPGCPLCVDEASASGSLDHQDSSRDADPDHVHNDD